MLAKVSNTAKAILTSRIGPPRKRATPRGSCCMRLALAQDNMAEADKILSEINPELEGVSQGPDGDGFRALVQVQDGQEAD